MGKLRSTWFPTLSLEERERRLRLFRTLLVAQAATAVLLASVGGTDVIRTPHYLPLLIGLALFLVLLLPIGYWLARRGSFHAGAVLLVLSALPFYSFFVLFYGTRDSGSYIFHWPIMLAAVLLEPRLTFLTTVLVSVLYGTASFLELYQVWPLPLQQTDWFAVWHQSGDLEIVMIFWSDVATVILGYVAVAFFAWIAVRSLRLAVARTQDQADELERYRVELEERVGARTSELLRTTGQLQMNLELLQEVGCPILQILEGVMLVPLVGIIDGDHANFVATRVLRQVEKERAQVVILDVTGVPAIDVSIARALLRAARGLRLLGTLPILVGVHPEVAETMLGLGVDWGEVIARASLQEGLAYALERVDRAILYEVGWDPDPLFLFE
jgi:rsbT co-antagonist protein RsbR